MENVQKKTQYFQVKEFMTLIGLSFLQEINHVHKKEITWKFCINFLI